MMNHLKTEKIHFHTEQAEEEMKDAQEFSMPMNTDSNARRVWSTLFVLSVFNN